MKQKPRYKLKDKQRVLLLLSADTAKEFEEARRECGTLTSALVSAMLTIWNQYPPEKKRAMVMQHVPQEVE